MSLLEYKTDHLLLLVGSNPLPNWVAAQLLLKEGGVLHLIHSADTAPIADRLRDHLQTNCSLLQVNPTDAGDIERQIGDRLRRLNGKIGLHYTGGTKAMAVHAYRAVEQALWGRSPEPVFSYLDANTFELRIDPDWHESVLLAVKITLKDLINLHGCYFQKGSPKRADSLVLRETAAALAKSDSSAWRHWCNHVLREIAHTGRRWKKKSDLISLALPWPDSPTLHDAVATLKRELGLPADAPHLPLDPAKLRWPFGKQKPEYLCRWLDGEWLEQYVLAQVGQVTDQADIDNDNAAMNLKTDKGRSDFDFEFDVAAMRGYQFFGISCTTSTNKGLAKSKLFEAYIRARQLGGDEARVALVCGYEDAKRFESEVVQEWLAKDKIKVFGPRELPNLAEHLTEWFMTTK